MNKKLKITLLELLVTIIFCIMSIFVEMDLFSFSLGVVYIMLFDVIERIIGDDDE